MLRILSAALAAVLAMGLTGCATRSHIDPSKFAPPKTVVIGDIPDLRSEATIRMVVSQADFFYFTPHFDAFYDLKDESGTALVSRVRTVASSNQGLIGALIDANAQDTENKAAQFPVLVRERLKIDLRTELLDSLTRSLQAKGVQVRMADDTRNQLPRPRWTYQFDNKTIAGQMPDSPPIDADLYVQLAPIALYAAPGPLNNYTARVAIAVLVYDARKRAYVGKQLFRYEGDAPSFATYSSLAASIDQIAPLLRTSLLSLVPQVADIIGGQRP